MELDLAQDAAALTACLVDVASVSGTEEPLADAIDAAMRARPHLTVHRDGNAVVARTSLGRPERVVLAGHIDTVPIAIPSRNVSTLPAATSAAAAFTSTISRCGPREPASTAFAISKLRALSPPLRSSADTRWTAKSSSR